MPCKTVRSVESPEDKDSASLFTSGLLLLPGCLASVNACRSVTVMDLSVQRGPSNRSDGKFNTGSKAASEMVWTQPDARLSTFVAGCRGGSLSYSTE
jgi:hypothetical protein